MENALLQFYSGLFENVIKGYGCNPQSICANLDNGKRWSLIINQRVTLVVCVYLQKESQEMCIFFECGIGLVPNDIVAKLESYISSYKKEIGFPVRLLLREDGFKEKVLCINFRSPAFLFQKEALIEILETIVIMALIEQEDFLKLGMLPFKFEQDRYEN
jgi:hypothetical protein